jgi:hypothetical protein
MAGPYAEDVACDHLQTTSDDDIEANGRRSQRDGSPPSTG